MLNDNPQKIIDRIRVNNIWLSDDLIVLILFGKLLIVLKVITNRFNDDLKKHCDRVSLASAQNLSIETEMQKAWLLYFNVVCGNFTVIPHKMAGHFFVVRTL